MITWILGGILVIWCLINRIGKGIKFEGQGPYGLPQGSIRAFIALLVVAFPFSYILQAEEIPSALISAIFILVAFYFDSRKTKKEEIKELIYDTKFPEKAKQEKKLRKYPLYLPKYSVRTILIILLVTIFLININGPNIAFEITNTIFDVLLIISFFLLGSLFRSIINIRGYKQIRKNIMLKLKEESTISDDNIIQFLSTKNINWWDAKGKNYFSIITLMAVIVTLLLYTINIDYNLYTLPFYQISLRTMLFFFINIYYGIRE